MTSSSPLTVGRTALGLAAATATLSVSAGLSTPAQAAPQSTAQPAATVSVQRQATQASGNPLTGKPIHRSTVIKRAQDWNKRNVQYSQSGTASAVGGGTYRRDCSGFVSMAWRISPTGMSAPTTWTLPKYGTKIAKSKLKAGDMMTWPHHHTVLFQKWANTSHTKFWLYEEASTASDMNHRVASLSSYGSYSAYRYKKILKG